jgi:hypothetical protein
MSVNSIPLPTRKNPKKYLSLYHTGDTPYPGAELMDKCREIVQKLRDDEASPTAIKDMTDAEMETAFAALVIRMLDDWTELWELIAIDAAVHNRARIKLKFHELTCLNKFPV